MPSNDIFALVRIGELAGAVRMLLSESGASTLTVQPKAARKLLLGKLASGSNENVRRIVTQRSGCESWQPHEVEAFITVNWLASECGGKALVAEHERKRGES